MKQFSADIFNAPIIKREVRTGSLLVAEPFLEEICFKRSVITIVDHSPESGTMGVVINNLSKFELGELLPELNRDVHLPVYCGGPLSLNRIYFLHTLGDRLVPGAVQCGRDLWCGGDFDLVIAYINDGVIIDGIVKFFIGYSGWSPGQLESEIDRGTWAVDNTKIPGRDLLTMSDDHLWHHIVGELGPNYRTWALHPYNPLAN